MKRDPLIILNFGKALHSGIKQEIAEELGREVDERRYRLAINAMKYTYPQVLRVIDRINFKDLPTDVVLHLPGIPIGAAYIVNEFYARTGIHPIILELVRDIEEEEVRRFGTLRNLELEIRATRDKRRKFLVSSILDKLEEKR